MRRGTPWRIKAKPAGAFVLTGEAPPWPLSQYWGSNIPSHCEEKAMSLPLEDLE